MNSSNYSPAKNFCTDQRFEAESTTCGRCQTKRLFQHLRSRNNLVAIATAILIASVVCAQAHTATAAVGFTTVTIPAGEVRALSLPLNNFPAYSGIITALSGNSIQTLNANWSNSFGPFESNPHVVRFLSGKNKGGQFKVLANTQDTLTLSASTSDVAASLSAGDRYDILPVATLQSLFGANAPGLIRNGDSNFADNVLLRDAFGWLTYYNDGTQWLRQGAENTAQNTVAILPEEGFLLVRRGDAALTFTIAGTVPLTNLQTPLPAGKVTALANRFPVDLRLSELKLDQLPGWVANSAAAAADSVLINESSAWRAYYFNGVDWLSEESGSAPQDPSIALGTSVLVVRLPGTDATFNQAPPY